MVVCVRVCYPTYPPDNHHCWDDVYWRGGEVAKVFNRPGALLVTHSTEGNSKHCTKPAKITHRHHPSLIHHQTPERRDTVLPLYRLCDANTHRFYIQSIKITTRSTGTVHTSTKAHLTSAAIWQISMSSRFMSINHFLYLPLVTNPKTIHVSRWWSGSPPKFNHLLNWPIVNLLENFMQIRLEVFEQSC